MNNDSFLRYNRDQKYLIYDSETCHLNLAWRENRPWQWAWMIVTKDKVISKTNLYIKWPNLKVSKDAARITGFDPEKVQRLGVSPEEALEKLDTELYNPEYKLVGHNLLNFDIYIHNMHRLSCGKPTDYSYLRRVYDTNYLIKGYKMGMQPRRDEDLLAYQMRLCNTPVKGIKTRLDVIYKEYGVQYSDHAHDADEDNMMLYPIWQKVLHQVEI